MPEEKQFVFKITSRLIERAIYIAIIVLLLLVIIVQNVNWIKPDNNPTATTVVTTTLATTTTAASSAAAGTGSTSTLATTTSSTSTTSAGTGTLSADIEFVGDPVADATTGKVTKVSFRITNRGDKFIPKVDFFWYDPAADTPEKTMVRATWSSLLALEVGQTMSDSLEPYDSSSTFQTSYVNKDEAAEVFVMKLYDRTTGKLLGTSSSKTIQSVKVIPVD
jgi:hypothetical protein